MAKPYGLELTSQEVVRLGSKLEAQLAETRLQGYAVAVFVGTEAPFWSSPTEPFARFAIWLAGASAAHAAGRQGTTAGALFPDETLRVT